MWEQGLASSRPDRDQIIGTNAPDVESERLILYRAQTRGVILHVLLES